MWRLQLPAQHICTRNYLYIFQPTVNICFFSLTSKSSSFGADQHPCLFVCVLAGVHVSWMPEHKMEFIVVLCYFDQGCKASHQGFWTIFERCGYVEIYTHQIEVSANILSIFWNIIQYSVLFLKMKSALKRSRCKWIASCCWFVLMHQICIKSASHRLTATVKLFKRFHNNRRE